MCHFLFSEHKIMGHAIFKINLWLYNIKHLSRTEKETNEEEGKISLIIRNFPALC